MRWYKKNKVHADIGVIKIERLNVLNFSKNTWKVSIRLLCCHGEFTMPKPWCTCTGAYCTYAQPNMIMPFRNQHPWYAMIINKVCIPTVTTVFIVFVINGMRRKKYSKISKTSRCIYT